MVGTCCLHTRRTRVVAMISLRMCRGWSKWYLDGSIVVHHLSFVPARGSTAASHIDLCRYNADPSANDVIKLDASLCRSLLGSTLGLGTPYHQEHASVIMQCRSFWSTRFDYPLAPSQTRSLAPFFNAKPTVRPQSWRQLSAFLCWRTRACCLWTRTGLSTLGDGHCSPPECNSY